MIIKYRNMSFVFETNETAWYDLDNVASIYKDYKLTINADREVYATLEKNGVVVEGYIVDENGDILADNFPIDESVNYKFKKHPKPGYYL